MNTDTAELRRLRAQLLDRIDAREFTTWSATLLRALIAVFDLDGSPPPGEPGRRLHVID